MDVASLLYRHRPVGEADFRRKLLALEAGYEIARSIDSSVSLDRFLDWSGEVVSCTFGGPAQDSYSTTALSVIRSFQPHIDPYAASILNGIVLAMNFQTRRSIDGVIGPQEAILFEGQRDMFPIAMMHGNSTAGIFITGEPDTTELPVWANAHPALEVNSERLYRTPPTEVQNAFLAAGTQRLGALLIVGPEVDWGPLVITERYASCAAYVSRHTIYCLTGAAEMIVSAAAALEERRPDIRANVRLYSRSNNGAIEHRGILTFSGLPELPDLEVCPGARRVFTFSEALHDTGLDHEDVPLVNYASEGVEGHPNVRHGKDGTVEKIGHWEPAVVKKPMFLFSSAPLPEEARERISEGHHILHSLAQMENGLLIPSQDHGHAIYMHATADAKIVIDIGDEGRNVLNSPIYSKATEGVDGVRRATVNANRLLRVRGAAMPLMFTPLLHKWHSHFMIQCLPRVRIAREIIARGLAEDVKLLLPHDMRAKQLEMLAVLGFGEDRVVKMPPGAIVQADSLFVPRPWRLAFTPYSTAIYQEIADHYADHPMDTPKRILISREARKTWRNLLNFEAVRELLVKHYDFELVAPEKLSLAEEIAVYANAEIVVGAEGAGMYGAAFSKPGSIYITLCDEDYVMPILATLATVRGFDISYVFGESMRTDSDVARRLPWGHADFVVDLEKIEQAVETAILKGRKPV